MKNVVIILVLAFSSSAFGQTSKLITLFEQYQKTSGITSIKIAKPMFQLLGQLNIEDNDLQKITPLVNKINSLRILIVEKDSSNETRFVTLQTEINNALKNLNYEELMTVNADDENIRFLAENTESNTLRNLVLSINGSDETMFMILEGEISMADVSNLISTDQN